MDGFYMFLIWTLVIGFGSYAVGHTFGEGVAIEVIGEQCQNVGRITVEEISFTCEPDFLKKNGKTYPLREPVE